MQQAAQVRRVFSGIQSSGVPHLGNYLGALRTWVKLQDTKDQDVIYSVVDLHALTSSPDPETLRANTRATATALLACGVDPKRSILFQQSRVSGHAELSWVLSCVAQMGQLNRMTQWKAKAQKDGQNNSCLGLFAYPVLMTADILLYKATDIPVGNDQIQHLELARDIAISFNHNFKAKVFPEPKPILGDAPRVMSLRNPTEKMSKSAPSPASRIDLTDTPDEIRQKIRRAVTDSISEILYNPTERPGVANLLSMYAALSPELTTVDAVVAAYKGSNKETFKTELAEVVIAHLAPIQDTMRRLSEDKGYVDAVLDDGAARAAAIAHNTLSEVKRTIGLSL